MKNWINPFWIGSVVIGFWANIPTGSAQVVPDNTLPVNSQVTGCPICIIEGGTVQGVNLFHSFEEFSVQTGGAGFFNNALDIENIISRVTGTNISDIDGLIGANGTANLFLINPNGIIFGENAFLNIGGSFVTSTANAIGFGDQGVFSATNPEAPPLLTVNPDALFFNQLANQGASSIEVRGFLSVPSGESLLLVGGNVAPSSISTGEVLIDNALLFAPGGRIELAAVGAPGAVGLRVDNGSLGLDFPVDLARTDMAVLDSFISVLEAGGGDIVIYPRNLSIANGRLFAGISSGLGSVDAQAGDITIDATGTVAVAGGFISNFVDNGATGKGGDVRIAASSVSVTNGAGIFALTTGEGDAGKVVIRATDSILLDGKNGRSRVLSVVASEGKGNSGGVDIETGSLTVINGADIATSTVGEGDVGKVVIRATDSILLDGENSQGNISGVFNTVLSDAKGNAGGVEIETGSLTVTNGASINASTFGEGNAGQVVIRAGDNILLDGEDSRGFPSFIVSAVILADNGNAGGVEIETGSLTVTNGASINASTFGEGNAGQVVIRASDNILLDGETSQGLLSSVSAQVLLGANGNAGSVEIESSSLTLNNGALISASTAGEGNAGQIVIQVADSVLLDGEDSQGLPSGVFSRVLQGANGNSPGITIESGSLSATNGARISAGTVGEGNAGQIVIRATDSILLDGETRQGSPSGIVSTVQPGALGNSGGVDIDTGSLTLNNGAVISASTVGEGDAGQIVIRATDSILLDGETRQGSPSDIVSTVQPGALGNSGGVDIDTGSLTLNNGAEIDASTFGEGDAGKIRIRATDRLLLDGENSQGSPSGIFSTVQPGALGNSGEVDIDTGSLTLNNGTRISASTFGVGNAGKIVVRAIDSLLLDGENSQGFGSAVFSQVESGAKGNSGGVDIESGSFTLNNGAGIVTSTRGEGDAGQVVIRATDSILFDGEDSQGNVSGVFSIVDSEAKGNSEGVDIESGSLTATNGAGINASTSGKGDAGQVVIRATDSILFDGEDSQGLAGGVFSQVAPGALGNSGGVEIYTGSLTLNNGAQISASTFGEGEAGKVEIRATDSILLDGEDSKGFSSAVFSQVESGSQGNSGGVEIETGSLTATNGAEISAETQSTGMAGDVKINATEFIQLSGNSAIRANATAGGSAGDLNIETGRISIADGAEVTVSSPSGQAGDLTLTADSLLLNQGRLSAITGTSDASGGANINLLGLNLLLLENESLVSANALEDANGGNVTIDSTFIVAILPTGVNGSDITANAVRGNGGRVRVTTQGLFNIEFRPQLTPDNDITVSSDFGIAGEFELNQPGIDPSRGLTQLPSTLVDPSGQINRTCAASNRQSQFTITGRGGLPENPTDLFSPDLVQDDFGTVIPREEDKETEGQVEENNSPISHPPKQIIEAQGWIIDAEGNVVLTAYVPNGTPHSSWQNSVNCQVSETASP